MTKHLLTLAAFFVATFGVQASNHFVLNSAHYASEPIVDPEPFILTGLIAMVLQGLILTFLYQHIQPRFPGWRGALGFSWVMGLFLASYIALGEPAKYLVENKLAWALTEACASFAQFTIFGCLLGLIHRNSDARF